MTDHPEPDSRARQDELLTAALAAETGPDGFLPDGCQCIIMFTGPTPERIPHPDCPIPDHQKDTP